MLKVVSAHTLKTQLGRILRELRENERFLVLRRNRPVGVLVSVRDYVKDHPDHYEDVEDFLDTLREEGDPAFQHSLKEAASDVRRARDLSHSELKLTLGGGFTKDKVGWR